MSVSLTADPKLVSRTKLNPLKLAKSTATEPHGYLHFCRTNMHVFTSTQYCIEKAMNFFLILLFNNNNYVHLSLYFPKFATDQSVIQCVVDVVDIFCWYEVCVWWRRYLLFRHRNCIRAWPGRHWPLVHGSWYNWVTKLAPQHDSGSGSRVASFVIPWSPGSHLNSLNKTGTGEESHQRPGETCIPAQMRVS